MGTHGNCVETLNHIYYGPRCHNEYNEKINLSKRLCSLSYEHFRGEHVQMNDYMISKTSINDLQRKYPDENRDTFAGDWHILFRDPVNLNYLSPIFQESDSDSST